MQSRRLAAGYPSVSAASSACRPTLRLGFWVSPLPTVDKPASLSAQGLGWCGRCGWCGWCGYGCGGGGGSSVVLAIMGVDFGGFGCTTSPSPTLPYPTLPLTLPLPTCVCPLRSNRRNRLAEASSVAERSSARSSNGSRVPAFSISPLAPLLVGGIGGIGGRV